MKPFKRKRRYRRKLVTYKRLFIATIIIFASYAWFKTCDTVKVNDNITNEGERHVR